MEKCQHANKITHFCIYEYCSNKEAAACELCLKKYHSHVGNADAIKTEDVDQLAEKFNLQNSVKPKCRQFQEHVFGFFTVVKSEISQTIDIVCKGMVNKIGYPFLSNLNHLSSYKRIKNKEYKKLGAKQLKKFHLDCKGLDVNSVTNKQRELYVEEIAQNFATIESLQKLMKDYENLAKKMCKNFKHDSSAFKKIQDLRKYLSTILKIDKKQKLTNTNNRNSDIDSNINVSNLETSPSDKAHLLKEKLSHVHQKSKEPQKKRRAAKQSSLAKKFNLSESQNNEKMTEPNSKNKQKFIRNFSVERENKFCENGFEFEMTVNNEDEGNSYESKEKEILERKEKLMKMMSLKEKSVGKVLEQSIGKNSEVALIQPPLLKYQKNAESSNEKTRKTERQSGDPKLEVNQNCKQTDSFLKVQTPQKQDVTSRHLSPSPMDYIKHSKSAKSFNQEDQLIPEQEQDQTRCGQEQSDQKYKYAISRLPSSQSNSSDAEIVFKSYLNSIKKGSSISKKKRLETSGSIIDHETLGKSQRSRRDKMSESSPVKIQLNSNKYEEIVTDDEKSAGLYLIALQKGVNNVSECIQYLKASLSYSLRNISAAEHLCSMYLTQNKSKQCLDLCNEYLGFLSKIGKNELKKPFIINKSAALNNLGRYSQSIILLESELLHHEDSKMYKNLGDAYFFVGINEKCQYNYQKAIKMNPKSDQAMYNLAVCMYTQGNYFNADVYISKAIQIDTKNIQYIELKKEIGKKLDKVHQESSEFQ